MLPLTSCNGLVTEIIVSAGNSVDPVPFKREMCVDKIIQALNASSNHGM